MALYQIKDLSFSYNKLNTRVLKNINCQINKGDVTVICGPSASGKTTLMRHLKKEVLPIGDLTGDIFYNNESIFEVSNEEMASRVGIVYQNPEAQMVMDNVIHELAFSLENIGTISSEIRVKIGEIITYFGLEDCLGKQVYELSGGQKQIINICSALILYPDVLILDEPMAQLDPVAAKELLKMIVELNQELGITIIISEHRLDDILQYADEIIYMDVGEICYSGTRDAVVQQMMEEKKASAFLPEITKLTFIERDNKDDYFAPLTVKQGREYVNRTGLGRLVKQEESMAEGSFIERNHSQLIECKGLYFMYNKGDELVLNGVNLRVHAGDFLAIVGGNGSGKTTLLKIIARLLRPTRGRVHYQNKQIHRIKEDDFRNVVGYVAQNTMLHITRESVLQELMAIKQRYNIGNDNEWAIKVIETFDLEPLLNRHPYDLSGGERQKLVIAMTLLKRPSLLLLDEPTKGLDPVSKEEIVGILKELNKDGMTIIMVSHDIEFVAKHIDRCAMLFNGEVVYEGDTKTFFKGNYFYTTKINKVMKALCNDLITIEDVMNRCQRKG